MKEKVAKKWIKDLRKPKNKQAKKALFDGTGYCCLGRLCVVAGYSFYKYKGKYVVKGAPGEIDRRESQVLPPAIQQWAGMNSKNGAFAYDMQTQGCLAYMNDHGSSFTDIADFIEKNWKGL